jgi:hypothetical protein
VNKQTTCCFAIPSLAIIDTSNGKAREKSAEIKKFSAGNISFVNSSFMNNKKQKADVHKSGRFCTLYCFPSAEMAQVKGFG